MPGGLPSHLKPHIKVWCKTKVGPDPYVWQCIGPSGRNGAGLTPGDAYWDWRSQFERVW